MIACNADSVKKITHNFVYFVLLMYDNSFVTINKFIWSRHNDK